MESRDYRLFASSVRSRTAQLMGQKSPAIRKDTGTDHTRSDRPACLLGTGTGSETKVEAPHCRMNSSLMGTLGIRRERAGSHSTLAELRPLVPTRYYNDGMTKLTAKQEAFVREYAANGGNATQAAIAAGYSPKVAAEVGSENLRKPQIVDAIKAIAKPKEEHALATIEGRAAWLRDVIDGKIDEEDTKARVPDKLKALELLGKMSGDFIERRHVTGDVQLNFTAFVPKKGSK
jgi:phage terminase small subunit